MTLREQFGDIDVYVFDQLLRGRIRPGMRVLDAGCGHGRNLVYLLQAGIEVFAIDEDPNAILAVRALAARSAPALPATHFKVESVEAMTIPDASMDVVISSAVLHFARDDAHFEAMVRRMWRTLVPGGLLFCRLAASTGIEARVSALGSGAGAKEARRRADELLEILRLDGYAHAPAAVLPHGHERKLGVARALAVDPQFVLMDEPAAGLPEAEVPEFAEVVRSVRDDHAAGVLLIDHNFALIMAVCDRVHVLDQGRTLASGTPEEIRRDPKVATAYLGHVDVEAGDGDA